MPLLPAVEEILSEVSSRTDRAVETTEDPSLTVLASVTMARPGIPFHLVRINSRHGKPDYLVAFQCGFILRQAALPDAEKWQLGPSEEAMRSGRRMVMGPGGIGQKLQLPTPAATQLTEQLVGGLLTQLRSVPIGVRIDRWIATMSPELRQLQAESMRKQLRENAATLAPQMRQMTPATIWRSTCTMNAVYATVAGEILEDRSTTLPYESAGILREAKPLLAALAEVTDDPTGDREAVTRWAKTLGLSDWIEFYAGAIPA